GYIINDQQTLNSNQFTLPTNYLINPNAIAPSDIKPSDITGVKFKDFTIISKLFNGPGLSQANLANLDIEKIEITPGRVIAIKLTPKLGYTLNDSRNPITSPQFNLNIRNLVISKNTAIPGDITQDDIDNPTVYKSKVFLDKLFNFGSLTQADIDNLLNITVNVVSGAVNYKITLNTKSIDEMINNSFEQFDSEHFVLYVRDIPITKVATVPTDITLADVQSQSTIKSKAFLSKLFILGSLTQEEIDELLIVTLETITVGMDYKITLSPNGNVTINGQSNEFKSDQFSLYVRNIPITKVATVPTDITLADVQNPATVKSKTFLSKLFNLGTITQLDMDALLNVTLETITAGMDYKITLSPKNIYVNINNSSNAFSSDQFSLQVTNIVITKTATIPTDIVLADVENPTIYQGKEFLSKLFNLGTLTQLEINEMLNVNLETITAGMVYRVSLSPKNIYVKINGQSNAFRSDQFSLKVTDIPISKVAILPSDIVLADVENPTIYKGKEFLSKLFNLGTLTQLEINEMLNVNLETITAGMVYRISLSPTSIYVKINGQSNAFRSDQFSLKVTDIPIAKAPSIPTDITLADVENPETVKSKEFLSKLFDLGT
ncbi:MAG: hypothetical protein ACRCXE_00935, partial [Metamycoplasmataceae bacterium]